MRSLSNLFGVELTASVADRQDDHSLRVTAIDHPVRPDDQLPHVRSMKLGDGPTPIRQGSEQADLIEQSIEPALGSRRAIPSHVLIGFGCPFLRQRRPDDPHFTSRTRSRFATVLCAVPSPAAT